ncbi:MAG: ComEC/Rec2 family competence protein, partial [bacterium]|nr:ComEC/Rec2 family competence protein [bacterium]
MRRPALAAAGLYGLGILGGCRWSLSVSTLLCASSILFLAVCVVFRFQRLEKQVGLLLGLLVCTLGILRYEAVTEDLPATHLVHFTGLEEEVEVWAEVVREPEEVGKDLRVYVDVRKVLVEGRPYRVQGLALIRFRKLLPDLEYGDGVRLRVRLLRPDPARNPGAFDYRNFLAQNGVYAVASVYRADQVLAVRVGGGTLLWNTVVLPVRRGVRAAVDNNLSGAPAGLLKGVLLGEKRGVPEDVKEAFRRCGVNHVLAVSGLHVGLIGAALFFGLGAMGLGRRA